MKSSSLIAAVGLFAAAQGQSQCNSVALAVPACATSCIQSAATQVGCAVLDFICQCGSASSAAINSAAFACVLGTCGPTTGLAVQTSANAVCSCAMSVAAGGGGSSSAPTSSAAVVSSMAASSVEGSSIAASSRAASSMMASGAASAGSSASMASSTAAASMASSAAPAGSSATSSSSNAAPFTGTSLQVATLAGAGLAVYLGLIVAL